MDGNGLNTWLVGGGLFTIAGFTAGIFWKVGKIKDEVQKRIDRNYDRLDEVKENMSEEYTRKDICQVLHKQISDDLTDIKTDLKLLLRKNGIHKEG